MSVKLEYAQCGEQHCNFGTHCVEQTQEGMWQRQALGYWSLACQSEDNDEKQVDGFHHQLYSGPIFSENDIFSALKEFELFPNNKLSTMKNLLHFDFYLAITTVITEGG